MTKKNIFYSTDGKTFCPDCEKKIVMCICPVGTENNKCLGPILIEKQTSGRRGKPVNVIKNILFLINHLSLKKQLILSIIKLNLMKSNILNILKFIMYIELIILLICN